MTTTTTTSPRLTKSGRPYRKTGRRPSTIRSTNRSFRAPEMAWEKLVSRAEAMSLPPSRVVTMLVEAFAAGDIKLPGVRYVYEGEQQEHTSPEAQGGAAALEALGDDFDADSEI